MKYLIDNTIEFNTDDGTLFYRASQDVIRLTLPAARLLEEFLSSGGHELTREYLLENVWDKYGLQASGSNLNQYVSILRRSLATFECNELIITLPKVGFKLNTAVNVTALPSAPAEKFAVMTEPEITTGRPQPPARSLWRKALPGLIFLLAACAGAALVWEYIDATNGVTEIRRPEIGCEILYLKDIPADEETEVVAQVSHVLKENHLTCNNENIIIYSSELSSSSKNNARTLLSLCSTGKKKEILSCDNFYHYSWIRP